MKKTFLSKLLTGFSGIIFFTYGIIFACAGGDDWDWWYSDSNFTPETFVDNSYSRLFLASAVFYNHDYDGFDTSHNSRFNDEIVSDWKNYLEDKIDVETLKYFITNDSSAIDLTNINKFIKTNNPNALSNKWSSKLDYKNKKVKGFIEFLSVAKDLEIFSTFHDYWSYEKAENNEKAEWKTITQLEKKYSSEKDEFIKNRYWFQVIKARFYSFDSHSVVEFFEKTGNNVPENTLYYRALAYVAGVNYMEKNYALSNYQYSVVFDKCPTMRTVSAYCFHPQEQSDWNQSLAMAKNNDEKAALWAVQGYYKNEFEAIEKIYELKPKSEHLDYLLTRLINAQEQKISKDFTKKTVQQNKKANKDTIGVAVFNLVEKIAKEGKTAKPYLWNCASGYLQTLNENFKSADSYFNEAEKQIPKTPLAANQLRLLRFVNNLSKMNEMNSKNESIIVNDLNWIYNQLPKATDEIFRYQNASEWSRNYIAAIYKAQNNAVMSELFVRNSDYYQNNKNLEDMKLFLSKNGKSQMEIVATGIYNVSLQDINLFQAVKATYENKIPEAIEFMKKADSLQYAEFYGNPFNGNIKDCHDCDHAAYQKKKYSKLEFLTTIKTMQDKVAASEDVYNNSILLGNAFYNITYFGNARIFYEINIMVFPSYDYTLSKDPYYDVTTDCSLSKKYYLKAFENAKTDEQRAKCQYMLAKCERNDYYIGKFEDVTDTWRTEDSEINFLAWNGFKNLKKDYSKTKFYQEVIRECGYFNTYINGLKKE